MRPSISGNVRQSILPPPSSITPIVEKYRHEPISIETPTLKVETSILVPSLYELRTNIDGKVKKEAPTSQPIVNVELTNRNPHTTTWRPKRSHIVKNTHLTIIRKRKMKRHQLRKFRKKFLCDIKRKRLKREIQKEKNFRAELLAQIKEAEEFDPEVYVKNMLKTIDNMPKPETWAQKEEKILELIRKNKSETNFVKPKFDDD